jgi:eukaryotic-like serine/threonine-protein kinase
MEYVDGDALSKLNRAVRKKGGGGGGIPHGIVLRVMADVCGGLHAAHELQGEDGKPLGVVHRDISPQNVLVSTRGVAKLIDFGIAKARDRLAGDTNSETLKGKVQYMAPEQALGRPVDRRADIWAVGAVLHHLIGGKPPFEAENEIQTLFVLSSGRPPPPLRGDVHPAVAVVVRRALSHSPAARFATAAEMQQALEDAIVKAGLSTSQATIASYLAEQMGDRADKRKEAIALGLKAADDREKIAQVMRSNTELPGAGSSSTGVSSASIVRAEATSPSLTNGKTIGSAAVSIVPDAPRRGMRFAIVGSVLGAAIVVLAILGLANRRGTSSPATAPHVAAVSVALPPPLATAAPPPPADAPPVPIPDIGSLPSASASASASAPAAAVARWPVRTASPPPAPLTPPTAAVKPAVPTRVNDGF